MLSTLLHPRAQRCACGRIAAARWGLSAFVSSHTAWKRKPPLTKIVATIGPVSESFEVLQEAVNSGMRVMRLNFSHATYEEAEMRIRNLKKCSGKNTAGLGKDYNLRSIMLDTKGPEIRTGNNKDGAPIPLAQNDVVILTTDPAYKESCDREKIWVSYDSITDTVRAGSTILLDDGAVSLIVLAVSATEVRCRVENSGTLKPRRGVNLPGAIVDLPALSAKDKADIKWGLHHDIDFVAASFVRTPADVEEIRAYIRETHAEFCDSGGASGKRWQGAVTAVPPLIISKIENMQAVDNFHAILDASDGIMVARGDLGVEVAQEKIPNLQKMMVHAANSAGKPVVVATQMLESMQVNPRPTRAEVSDVCNATYDGADAVMLSGESAQGKFPIESIKMMRRIISEAEDWNTAENGPFVLAPDKAHADGVASSAVHAAHSLGASMILAITRSGRLPRLVAKYRPRVPVVCYCGDQKTARLLMLHRGLHPIVAPPNDAMRDADKAVAAIQDCQKMGFCRSGDTVVVVTLESLAGFSGRTQTLRVCQVL